MLILSRKVNQEIVFPTIGVTIEVTRIRGTTVCMGIEAPKTIPILRGELASTERGECLIADKPILAPDSGDELRSRINAMSQILNLMKVRQAANLPIESYVMDRALLEFQTIQEMVSQEIVSGERVSGENMLNPTVAPINLKQEPPLVKLADDATEQARLLAG